MLETVHVKLYFDNGQIRYDVQGVGLGEFNLVEKDIKRMTEITLGP
jgi:hypothetical protein